MSAFSSRQKRYLREMGIDVWVTRGESAAEDTCCVEQGADSVRPEASVVVAKPGGAAAKVAPVPQQTVPAQEPCRLELGCCQSSGLLALGSLLDGSDLRLLQNIVIAATGTYGQVPSVSTFRWPQTAGPDLGDRGIDTSVEGAAKALWAYTNRRVSENEVRLLLFMGDAIKQTLGDSELTRCSPTGETVAVLLAPDLRYLRYHAGAKRSLWEDLLAWQITQNEKNLL